MAYRRQLEAERDGLNADVGELALKAAQGDAAAKAELQARPNKLAGLQVEIDANHLAYDLQQKRDSDAEIVWRTSLHSLPQDQLLKGLNPDECPIACQHGAPGGCILAGGAPHAGATCWHPCRFGSHDQFNINDAGKRVFPHQDHPPAAKIFRAAVQALKLSGKFAP